MSRKRSNFVAKDGKHYWNCWTRNYQPNRDGYCIHAFCAQERTGRTLCGATINETGLESFPSEGRPSCFRCRKIMKKRGVLKPDNLIP